MGRFDTSRRMVELMILAGIVLIGLVALPGSSEAASPAAAVGVSIAGDGTFRVGKDIKPGTYVSSAASSFGGYWERLSCATGDLECVLANANVKGQSFVTILPSDKFFSSSRMKPWKRAGSVEPVRPARRFAGDGMFRVGVDIAPGTYKSTSSGSGSGYWQRSSCATGVLDCVLANDNVDGQAFVEILPTDKFFTTNRMKAWSKVG